MMEQKKLDDLIAKYDKQYESNYEAYQETGITRYSTAYHKAEDMADALRMAANAKRDHDTLVTFRVTVGDWAHRAGRLHADWDDQTARQLLSEMALFAHTHGL